MYSGQKFEIDAFCNWQFFFKNQYNFAAVGVRTHITKHEKILA